MASIEELGGLIFTEYINLSNGLKIIQNWDKIIETLPEHRQKKIKDKAKDFDPLNNLKKMCKEKNDIIHTTYKYSKTLKTYGRLFANNASLQGLPREIRNALAYGLYYDIDMKNAHPTLLSQYCKKNGIRCEILDEYVRNRQSILEKIAIDNNISIDEAKQEFLSVLNGGNTKINNTFMNDYKNEVKLIHKQVIALNPEEYRKVKNRKEQNINGSVMNILLCCLEHQMMMNAVLFLRKKGFNVDVLVFDGFMVRKEENKIINDELLSELNIHLKNTVGYDIQFVEKSLENTIDLSVYIEPILDEKEKITYFKDKEQFEKTHLKIIHPVMYLTIFEDGCIDYQTEEKIKGSYKHKKTTILENGKVIKVPFINVWLNDEHIRVYDKMVFEPPPCVYNSHNYNTWSGFSIQKIELPPNFDINTNEYILKYKEFIANLFDNNTEYINYYDAWCANIIQFPAKRSSVCLVLYSLFEGVGKNMSTRTLELCVGENYTFYVSDVSNQLFGKHSSVELNRLLVVLNEVKGKDTYTNTDLFKTRITDEKREIELKGKDTIQIKNYCSYILNTNNLKAVNAGDKDRRFCVLPCVNKKINDKKYFDEYEKNINKNPEAIRCIYEYLKTYDIEKIVPDKLFARDGIRPKSDLYRDLQICNREKEWDFLEDLVNHAFMDEDGNDIILKKEYNALWTSYKTFCNNNNYDINKYTSKTFHYVFTHTIIDYLNNTEEYKDIISKKDRTATERFYSFDVKKLKEYFRKT